MNKIAHTLSAAGLAAAAISTGANAETSSFNWSGNYVSIFAGHNNLDADGIFDSADSPDRQDDFSALSIKGFDFGVRAGRDFQVGNFVLGGFADIALGGGSADSANATNDGSLKIGEKSLASLQVRAGYPMKNMMPYISAGIAHTKINVNHEFLLFVDPTFGGDTNLSDTGTVVGLGVEWALSDSVTFSTEAQLYNFDISDDLTALGGDRDAGDNLSIDRMVKVKALVNFRF